MNDLTLAGCRPEPLAHYLKALGVLRVLSEQKDSQARGKWEADMFHLETRLDREEVLTFFSSEYRPTPIIAPWNGGSGFYYREGKSQELDPATGKRVKSGSRTQPTAATKIVEAVAGSTLDRLEDYRKVIAGARRVLAERHYVEAPKEDAKEELMRSLRNQLPDAAIPWLDAAFVLSDRVYYPPLLGTGGNDGNADFTSNFMQRLLEVFSADQGAAWLRSALFNETVQGLSHSTIGQFYPGAAGGANATAGFQAEPLMNPWDFILMLEGALIFAAAIAKRLGTSGTGLPAFPFTVRPVSVGYGSASGADEGGSRAEMWMPLWDLPATSHEVMTLFAEGRVQVGNKTAANGVDFARAVAGLGIDRGITAFWRYGFQVRNGLSYFATPLGRWQVVRQPEVDLLNDARLSGWLERLRRVAKAPSGVASARRNLERAIMEVSRYGGPHRMAEVLIALGQAEAALASSLKFTKEAFLQPLPPLSLEWLKAIDDKSVEFRLAAAVASIGLRENLGPISLADPRQPAWTEPTPRVVWGDTDLSGNLYAVLCRRAQDALRKDKKQLAPDRGETDREPTEASPKGLARAIVGKLTASLDDIRSFILGEVDDERLAALIRGLVALDWSKEPRQSAGRDHLPPLASYALLKLVHLAGPLRPAWVEEVDQPIRIPYDPAIARRAWTDEVSRATALAAARLRGSGFHPVVSALHEPPKRGPRLSASLLFPVSGRGVERLAALVLQRPQSEKGLA